MQRPVDCMVLQHPAEASVFFGRQEAFGLGPPVSADARAGIAVLRSIAPGFRLPHDDGKDRNRAVGRGGVA